jgi:hypothetical protein
MATSPQDFSPKAVSRAVLRGTLSRPYVLYPVAAGILGVVAAAVLGPTLPFLLTAGAGALLGLGAFGFDYGVRRDKLASDYVRRLHEALAGRVEETIAALHHELEQAGHREALDQLERLQRSFAACENLLQRKLAPGEMTYNRYLGMTEQVFLAGLDNLRQIVDALHSTSTIDVRRSMQRLEELDRASRLSEAQRRERTALLERMDLLRRQRDKVDIWLAENEQALTQMDHVMAAIAAMETATDQAKMDMGPALEELQGLIDRAHQYIRADSDEGRRAEPQRLESERIVMPPPGQGT